MNREHRIGILQAMLATVFFSTGAILVRWAAALSPLEITSLRLLVGGGLVGAVAWAGRQRLRLNAAEWRRVLPIGVIAALHFIAFITSLTLTTVAHSLTITYTAPLFIAGLSRRLLGEPLPRRTVPGATLAVLGIAVLAGFQPDLTPRMLIGDLWAAGSAVTFALYSVYGRRERGGIPVLAYASWVYLLAGLVTAPFAVGLYHRPIPVQAIAAVVAMAIFPMALGHTLYNAAVRRLHPSVPNLIATQEVTLAILLAWPLLGEPPTWNAVAGAALTLAGVALVLR
ncbi:MAG: DMT family transporter [candidate division NC10 bacterium]|nr:DMT family transporter [candidate division NC10 bacterium]